MPDKLEADTRPLFSENFSKLVKANQLKLKVILTISSLVIIAIIFGLGLRNRQHIIKEYRALSKNALAQAQSAQADLIEDTRLFLIELAKVPAIQDPANPACGAFLAQTLIFVPQYANLGVSSADGQLRCNASPLTSPVNVADRPQFEMALDNNVFSIGTFQFDRAAQMTSLNLAYPVTAAGDASKPIAAVVAVISLDWWSAELESADLPAGTVAFIIDRENQIVAAYPPRPDLLGKAAAKSGFDPEIHDEIITEPVVLSDGIQRIFTRTSLFDDQKGNRVVMSLGVPVDAGIKAANRQMIVQIVALTGVLAIIWLLTIKQMSLRVFEPMRLMISDFERIERDTNGLAGVSGTKEAASIQQVTQSFQYLTRARYQAEADRETQAEQMSALIDALPDSYFRIDQQSRILECRSSRMSDLLMPPKEFLGRKLSEVLPADALEKFNKSLAKHNETGKLIDWEYELEIAGETRVFEARLSSISSNGEKVIVVRNVTARRLAMQKREAAEARLEQIITNLPGATISLNMNDLEHPVPTFVSKQVDDIWGYSATEALADFSLLTSTADPSDAKTMLKKLVNSVKTFTPFQLRYKITTRAGEQKWLQANCGASQHPNGEVHIDAFVWDVTNEVETQIQLDAQRDVAHQAQKNESIGLLTGGVAHDFNNLLAIIMGNLELLRDDLSDAEQISLIDAGIGATKRGADLTRSMLAFARKARLTPEVVDLNRLVSETRNWSGRTLPASIAVETSLLAGLWQTKADPGSTESALLNLILNARDAMPDGGKLTLETANVRVDQRYVDTRQEQLELGRYVMLAVSDTGEGIEPAAMAQIFEPFYSTKPPGSGSGLGLSMIQGFMNQSGGSVQVYSEPGVGTTFKLYFKALGPDIKKPRIEPPEGYIHAPNGQRILVAEDEVEVLAIIVATLEKAGYAVVSARTGDEACAIFEADPHFDLLLTDIVMPGTLQGTTLGSALRQLVPGLPVVFMSGYANEAAVHGNGLRPEDTRLMKPVTRADLLAAIKIALQA